MSWTDPYMTIPHRKGGRTRAGADCFGLYFIMVTDATKLAIDQHPGIEFGPDAIAAIEAEIASGCWTCIVEGAAGTVSTRARELARKFDVVLMTAHVKGADGVTRRADLHVGCALGDGWMLHSEAPNGPEIVAIDDPSIAHRVRAVYRPAALVAVAAEAAA